MLKTTLLAGAVMLFAAGAAQAADVVEAVPAVSDWTGFYAGIHGGYGWGTFDYPTTWTTMGATNFENEVDADGFFAGVQAGFNWQMDSFLFGIEGDISKSWIGGDDDTTVNQNALNIDSNLDQFGTARLRAGILATPDMLVYATGGLAWGSVDTDINFNNGAYVDSESTSHMGWTIGGGVEYALSDNLSLKAEYLYVDLGEEDVFDANNNAGRFQTTEDLNFHTIRAGLNFRF